MVILGQSAFEMPTGETIMQVSHAVLYISNALPCVI